MFFTSVVSIFLGFLVGAVVLALAGFNPIVAYKSMILGIFSKPKYLAWVIVRSTPLILTGLSVSFAFRTGLFNIGAEGQFMVGALVVAILGYVLKLPAIIHIPLTIGVATIAAGLYGGIAGYLKSKFGVHEVICTIMLNWIALYITNYVVALPGLKNPGPESTYDIHETARISIDWLKSIIGPGVKTNWGFIIALAIVAIFAYYLFKTTMGFELRAVGFNKDAAQYAGINVRKSTIKSMFIAGALAGLAGALQVSGVSYHISKLAVSEGYGFNGIAVALMGNTTPIGVVVSGLLFGGIQYGSTKMQFIGIPSEVINIVIGSIVFFVAISRVFKVALARMKNSRRGAE